jgi:hypothetical protein
MDPASLVIALVLFVVLVGGLAMLVGADSRDGFNGLPTDRPRGAL